MWIVRLALRRPYTFVVAALIVVLVGLLCIQTMPKDIFPDIDIPVISVIWTYTGMSPDEMEKRVVTLSERAYTGNVNDIEHIESQVMTGIAHTKLYFHPGAKIEAAVAQVTAVSQTILRVFPPGMNAPFILRYSASNVPVVQMSVSSEVLSEQEIFDAGFNFIRSGLFTVQGATVPTPFGGRPRAIMVDLNPARLTSKGLSAKDVTDALTLQNLILPAGSVKLGDREYNVRLNSSPELLDALNGLPIKQIRGATVYLRDVAQVRDGYSVQTNIVRENGKRSTLLTILKNGGASTLDVVRRMKEALPNVMAGLPGSLPQSLKVTFLADQSKFVEASLHGVRMEAAIAALLTGMMILLFIGSWRSTVIVALSIPLSILCSIIVMKLFGQTLNLMTLGGLALAVGILVDDSTVEIENIHRNLAQGKEINAAILDGAQQIAVPAFVSTLAICIVFAPVFFLSGAAKFLFVPLAMAVVFAMLASYLISRTLVPTLIKYLLRSEVEVYRDPRKATGPIWALHHAFNHRFEAFRSRYRRSLDWSLDHRVAVLGGFLLFIAGSMTLYAAVGQDFFPQVDAGHFRLHVRAPAGTRLEANEEVVQHVEDELRKIIAPQDLESMLDSVGMATTGSTIAYADPATIGSADAEILVSLKEHRSRSTWDYVREIRRRLPARFPGLTFFFEPADMVGQIINFGLPAPIDIQIVGRHPGNYEVAKDIERKVAAIPGAVDVHLHQPPPIPELRIDVDRTKASELGLTQSDVASSVLVSLSGSGQTQPNYWLNWKNGVNYQVFVQTPQYAMDSIEKLESTPVTQRATGVTQLLGNLSSVTRATSPAVVNHYNVQPLYNVYVSVQDRDLASVAREVDRVLAGIVQKMPKGNTIVMRGQVESMRSSFVGLAGGLVIAILLVYFLMVVNFQSWLDPFIIATVLPGALAGILWMLYATGTTLNVPSLMGAIMGMGVATANSILLVTFANDRREEGADARTAALDAGFTRLRPVLMTAGAMIIGMLPMALGLGEGGEQNAPLGRAVIGGLIFATVSTLFFVPLVYSALRRVPPKAPEVLPG